jgi:hypothetical protein
MRTESDREAKTAKGRTRDQTRAPDATPKSEASRTFWEVISDCVTMNWTGPVSCSPRHKADDYEEIEGKGGRRGVGKSGRASGGQLESSKPSGALPSRPLFAVCETWRTTRLAVVGCEAALQPGSGLQRGAICSKTAKKGGWV